MCLHRVMWAWWKCILSFCSCIWAEEVSWVCFGSTWEGGFRDAGTLFFKVFLCIDILRAVQINQTVSLTFELRTSNLNAESRELFLFHVCIFFWNVWVHLLHIYCTGRDKVALCSALYGTCRCQAGSLTELWSSCLLSVKPFWGCPFCDKWEESQEGQQQSS